MTRSPVLADGRRWQATILALLVLVPRGAARPPQEPAPRADAPSVDRVDPQALLPADEEHELRYARALAQARRGDLAGAVASLEALGALPLDDELATHVASDLERVRRFEALRDLHLSSLVDGEGTLRLELEGRDLTFHVRSVDEERVVFRNTLFGVSSLPVARLDSLQVAKQIPRDLDGPTGRWVRLYPYLLSDVARGLQLLRRDCRGLEQAATLLEDAERWYPGVLDLVDIAEQLEQLATRSGVDGAAGAATLDHVRHLLAEHGDLDPVRRRLGALRVLAAACLEVSFSAQDLLAPLAARRELLADGSLRLVYDFDRPEQLDDFRPAPGYPPERVAALPALEVHAGASRFELADGDLVVAGSRSWKHVLPVQGAIVVRCRLRVEAAPAGGSGACFWMIGACDDGRESYVALQELGTAMAIDRARGFVVYAPAEPRRRLSVDTVYELELACDGETVRTRVDGELVKEVSAGGRIGGELFWLVHSDAAVRIERLELEVGPGGLSDNTAWMEARLGALGFPQTVRPASGEETGVQ